jgi:Zn-dependent protease with chaperone function
MNFFEHQKQARRNTLWLIALYLLAVLGILGAIDVLVSALYTADSGMRAGASVPQSLHVFVVGIAAAVILGATAYKVIQLADGGEAVARMVGARRLMPQSGDLDEKRLLNVVEEMAIASGTAVPAVYVMDDEAAINAFAAGYAPNQAIVAVTRGALEKLNRDELQGVIGHEFSHILNGDMRINVRMIGVLFGITVIGSIGRFLMRATSESRGSRSRNGGSAQAGIFALGLGLFAIGAIGVFFARLIKAAVSRQREFLADASAVQFTRNPDGLVGALDRILATGAGTLVDGRYAEELSHMFFGQSVKMFLAGLMDTHPPLDERIRRVRPGFQRSTYRSRRAQEDHASTPEPAKPSGREAWGSAPAMSLAAGSAALSTPPEQAHSTQPERIVASVGNPSIAHVRYAHDLLASIPSTLRMMTAETKGAQALVLGLVLAHDEAVRTQQIDALSQRGMQALASNALAQAPLLRKLGAAYVLPLLDLALPALKTLLAAERERLLEALRCAIEADRKVTLQEFVLLSIAKRRLSAHAGRSLPAGKHMPREMKTEIELVLSLIAHAGHKDAQWTKLAFERAAMLLRLVDVISLKAWAEVRLPVISDALHRLHDLTPDAKARMLEACVLAVTADESISLPEAELVRLIASELDLPLPPILEAMGSGL